MSGARQQIALGTAQFGLDYGITNSAGRVPPEEAAAMLACAWDGGVHMLDTAHGYGSSEASLKRAFTLEPCRAWQVVTKTPPLRLERIDEAAIARVDSALRESLQALGHVDTLLVHHADDLLVPGGEALYAWMRQRQEDGLVRRIGVSIYDGTQAVRLLERYALDVVQLPASIAEQRLVKDGTVQRLADGGVEIHVRSLYLQGLLLANPAFVASRFPGQAAWAQRFRDECRNRGLSPIEGCLSFFRAQEGFAVAVIGAASRREVADLLSAWQSAPSIDWRGWAVDNPIFTDPRQWTPR